MGDRFVRRAMLLVAMTLATCALVIIGIPSAASAHATVVSTDPADGSIVPSAPASVSVIFDEPVSLDVGGALRVFAPDGQRVDVGTASHPAGKSDAVVIALGGHLAQGTYTVSWHVVSADSHPVSGGFTFSIGAASASSVNASTLAGHGSAAVGAAYAVARTAAYLGFALLLGPLMLGVRRLVRAGWITLVIATSACLGLQGPYAEARGFAQIVDAHLLGATLDIHLGQALVARMALLVVAALTFRLPLPRRARQGIGITLAIALAATWTASGHAATGIQVLLAAPVDTIHLLAAAMWLGGLATAVTADAATLREVLPRFSKLAYVCVITLCVTGLYQSWRQVGSLTAFTETSYGHILLIKLAGFALLVALGAFGRTWIARYTAQSPAETKYLRRSLGLETTVGAVVLVLTALLVAAPPARTASRPAVPIAAVVAFDTGGPNGSGTVELTVNPGRTGTNALTFAIMDAKGRPEQVPEVRATIAMPSHAYGPLQLPLLAADAAAGGGGAGHYTASAPMPFAGTWQLVMTVRTSDIDEATVTMTVNLP